MKNDSAPPPGTGRARFRLLQGLLRALARLPLPLLHAVGSGLGRAADAIPSRARTVATINLSHCFPEQSASENRRLRRAHFRETGKTLFELPALMHRPVSVLRRWVRGTQGGTHLHEALAAGRGVILASPHLGAWELLPHWLVQHGPITVLYRPPRQEALGPLILNARTRSGAGAVETTPRGVRSLLAALRRGEMVGILPDQEPEGNEPYAPFFGQRAKTMTLVNRLAARAGCPVLFTFAERLPAGRGYRIHFLPAPEGIRASDPEQAATALNRGVEACIRCRPDQYQWTYRRFSSQADGSRLYPRRRRD